MANHTHHHHHQHHPTESQSLHGPPIRPPSLDNTLSIVTPHQPQHLPRPNTGSPPHICFPSPRNLPNPLYPFSSSSSSLFVHFTPPSLSSDPFLLSLCSHFRSLSPFSRSSFRSSSPVWFPYFQTLNSFPANRISQFWGFPLHLTPNTNCHCCSSLELKTELHGWVWFSHCLASWILGAWTSFASSRPTNLCNLFLFWGFDEFFLFEMV